MERTEWSPKTLYRRGKMTEQPTLQDCIDELHEVVERVTKVQKMIQSVSKAVLNGNCNKAMEDYESISKIENIEERREKLKEWMDK